MERPLRLTDFALLAAQFEVTGEVIERAAEAAGEDSEEKSPLEGSGEGALEFTPPSDVEETEDRAEEEWVSFELSVEGADLTYSVGTEEDEFVLIIQAWLTEKTAPYNLHVVMGARFDIPSPPVTREEAAATLLFMAYPYLRETLFGITGRSPYQPFQLPPLARLPHPRVRGEADETATE